MTACMRRAVLWIIPGSTADALTFGLAQARGSKEAVESFDWVRVATCDDPNRHQDILWEASGSSLPQGIAPTRIRYGVAPPRFRTEKGPRPLTPGCYVAHVSGEGVSAAAHFLVDSLGGVQMAEPAPIAWRSGRRGVLGRHAEIVATQRAAELAVAPVRRDV
jgi:hypothetical protein